MLTEKEIHQKKRKKRVRSKIFGTKECPRLSVFISNKHIVGQIINDEKGETLVYVSDQTRDFKNITGTKTEVATKIGEVLAKKAIAKKIKKVIFDRGGKLYHGRVKALAEGVRNKGLEF